MLEVCLNNEHLAITDFNKQALWPCRQAARRVAVITYRYVDLGRCGSVAGFRG